VSTQFSLDLPLPPSFCSSRVEKNGVDNDSSSSDSSDSDSSDSEDAGKGKKSVRKEDDLFAACGQRELRLFKQEGKAARYVTPTISEVSIPFRFWCRD
jgi:hypothetical protein